MVGIWWRGCASPPFPQALAKLSHVVVGCCIQVDVGHISLKADVSEHPAAFTERRHTVFNVLPKEFGHLEHDDLRHDEVDVITLCGEEEQPRMGLSKYQVAV